MPLAPRDGCPVNPTLARTLAVTDGTALPMTVFTKDVRTLFPRGDRLWFVVRYGAHAIATGEVRLAVT